MEQGRQIINAEHVFAKLDVGTFEHRKEFASLTDVHKGLKGAKDFLALRNLRLLQPLGRQKARQDGQDAGRSRCVHGKLEGVLAPFVRSLAGYLR